MLSIRSLRSHSVQMHLLWLLVTAPFVCGRILCADHTILHVLISTPLSSPPVVCYFIFQAVGASSAFSKRFLSGDAIIGVVIGCVGVLAALLAAVVVVVRRRGTVRTRGDSSDCGSDDSEAQVCVICGVQGSI